MDCVAIDRRVLPRTGMDPETLQGYLQVSQQQRQAAGPQEEDRAHLAGLLGDAAPAAEDLGGTDAVRAPGSARRRSEYGPHWMNARAAVRRASTGRSARRRSRPDRCCGPVSPGAAGQLSKLSLTSAKRVLAK